MKSTWGHQEVSRDGFTVDCSWIETTKNRLRRLGPQAPDPIIFVMKAVWRR